MRFIIISILFLSLILSAEVLAEASNNLSGFQKTAKLFRDDFEKEVSSYERLLRERCVQYNSDFNSNYPGSSISCTSGDGTWKNMSRELVVKNWRIKQYVRVNPDGTVMSFLPEATVFAIAKGNNLLVLGVDLVQAEKSEFIKGQLPILLQAQPRFLKIHPKIKDKNIIEIISGTYEKMVSPKGIDMFTFGSSIMGSYNQASAFWTIVYMSIKEEEEANKALDD